MLNNKLMLFTALVSFMASNSVFSSDPRPTTPPPCEAATEKPGRSSNLFMDVSKNGFHFYVESNGRPIPLITPNRAGIIKYEDIYDTVAANVGLSVDNFTLRQPTPKKSPTFDIPKDGIMSHRIIKKLYGTELKIVSIPPCEKK